VELTDKIANTEWSFAHALWHPKWGVHIWPTSEQKKNIEDIAKKLQIIKGYFDKPITINSWLRCEPYNTLIGGKVNSQHIRGGAVDFKIEGIKCDLIREVLQPKLVELEIRCENLPKAEWVHIDNKTPKETGRFFRP